MRENLLREEIYKIMKSGKIPNHAMLEDWYRRIAKLEADLADRDLVIKQRGREIKRLLARG